MRKLIKTIILLFLFNNILLSQSSKTFVRNLELQTEYVYIDFPSEVVIKENDKDEFLMTLEVSSNVTQSTLDNLTKSNRYLIVTEIINGITFIRIPKLIHTVRIGNSIINENIKCEINLPSNIKIKKINPALN